MNINKQSIVYKFMYEGFVLCDETIPDNLCPYMRRFIKGVLFTFILFFALLWAVQALFLAPLLVLFDAQESFYMTVMLVAAGIGYILIVGNVFVYFFKRAKAHSPLSKAANYTGDVAVRAWGATTSSLFGQWIKAIHDKVCPTITFTDKAA